MVICGHCNSRFNALRVLYDEYPQGEPAGFGGAPLRAAPVLGSDGDLPARTESAGSDGDQPAAGRDPRRRLWHALLAALVLVTLFNFAWTFGNTLLEQPGVRDAMVKWHVPGVEPPGAFRDVSRIHLVSRDIHPHPTRAGILVLSATFVNLAERAQPYPDLSLTLLDVDNHALAARTFKPADYLRGDRNPASLLQPGAQVPILLEFADPGKAAVGFDIEFR